MVIPKHDIDIARRPASRDRSQDLVVPGTHNRRPVSIGEGQRDAVFGRAPFIFIGTHADAEGRDAVGLLLLQPLDDICEWPSRANRGKLVRVAHQDQPAQRSCIQGAKQRPEQVGRDHGAFVNDDGRRLVGTFLALLFEREDVGHEPSLFQEELVDCHRVALGLRRETNPGLPGWSKQECGMSALGPVELLKEDLED